MEGGISMFYPKKLIVPVFVCAVLAGVGLHFLYARFPCTPVSYTHLTLPTILRV